MGGIFVVLLGGLTLAVVVALLEFTWNARKNSAIDKVREKKRGRDRDSDRDREKDKVKTRMKEFWFGCNRLEMACVFF